MFPQAIADLNIWREAYTRSTTPLTTESINDFYGSMEYYTPTESTVKKKLNPDFTITNETQENVIHCILHARRLTTLHEGLRWQDIKRYGITIYRRLMVLLPSQISWNPMILVEQYRYRAMLFQPD